MGAVIRVEICDVPNSIPQWLAGIWLVFETGFFADALTTIARTAHSGEKIH